MNIDVALNMFKKSFPQHSNWENSEDLGMESVVFDGEFTKDILPGANDIDIDSDYISTTWYLEDDDLGFIIYKDEEDPKEVFLGVMSGTDGSINELVQKELK